MVIYVQTLGAEMTLKQYGQYVLRNLSVLPTVLFLFTAILDFEHVLRNLSVLSTLC
jgi:hypothetical protein